MLNTLRDITQAVASARDLDAALELLVKQIKTAIATECCSIYILDKEKLVLSATDGLKPSAVGNVRMPITEGLVGLVAEREEAINLADARQHPRFKLFPEAAEEEYRAFLAVPIIYQKQLLGVIVVQQAHSRQFSEGEEAFLMTLAAQLAMAIRGLKQKASVKSREKQILFQGTPASNGIAIAHALVLGGEISLQQPNRKALDVNVELERLSGAVTRCRNNLGTLTQRFDREQDQEVVAIFSALTLLLDDSSLGGEYVREVEQGWCAESAISRVSLRYIEQFRAMDDPYIKERASDIHDLGQKVLRQLIEPDRLVLDSDKPVILVTKEADTTLLAEFPRAKLAGIVTELGGVNSHAAIFARALGIPALTGVQQVLASNIDRKMVVLNATRGQLMVSPSGAVISEYRSLLSAEKALQRQFMQEVKLPAQSLDGERIQLFINAGLISGLASELAEGADGVGLYRTEIPFMLHQRFPSESEQIKVYTQVLDLVAGRPVVMRTLDVGGDKPLPYFPIKEENPFLGWRGIRLSLDHPELFLVQIRAMLQANGTRNQLKILLPMVSNLVEIDHAIEYFHQAYHELKADMEPGLSKPQLGVMLEVPALLYQLDEVAKRVDFISVGSNDLTQYLLAVDRNNPRVSALFDSYHPGVLRYLQTALQQCRQHGLGISICGEMAGEPAGALLLSAMGYRELSMNQGALAKINYLMRRVSMDELQRLLQQALTLRCGLEVRELLRDYLDNKGLAALLN
ncbi:phosphoenolpyruvate--protein phosphotransferase [Shewanella sp. YIC-542]|uniref:phosphoenolpyruvate--protein phosphotransferase n=1 Tax=Shewanella mytili TaxID=3377111 RepID=UPI00398ECEB2